MDADPTRQAEIASRQPSRPLHERLSALIKEARQRARRRRGRAVAAIVLSASLFFGGFIAGYLSHRSTIVKRPRELGTVLVAKRLILKGTSGSSIAARNLFTVATLPKEQLAPRAISDAAVLQGRIAAGDIYQNQELTASDFTTLP